MSSKQVSSIPDISNRSAKAVPYVDFLLSRAWHAVGLSIRYAQTRGLYLINDSPGITEGEKELEVRLWHATCALERFLGFLTGRTGAIQNKHNSQRFPRPLRDHVALGLPYPSPSLDLRPLPYFALSTPMLSFGASLELDHISSVVLFELYIASTKLISWSRVQTLIAQFNHRLENWRARLSSTLTMEEGPGQDRKAPMPERMSLELRYFSVSMLINRPCLCIPNEGHTTIPSQSPESKDADSRFAVQCVSSARGLMKLLPDDVDIACLYSIVPWWSILHYIVQAGAIFVMEISLQSVRVSSGIDGLTEDARKVLKWLRAMSITSGPAFRAWTALSHLLQLALSGVGQETGTLSNLMPDYTLTPGARGEHLPSSVSSSTVEPFSQYLTGAGSLNSSAASVAATSSSVPFQATHAFNPTLNVYMPSLPAHDSWTPEEYPAGATDYWSTSTGEEPSQFQQSQRMEVDIPFPPAPATKVDRIDDEDIE